MFKMFVYVCCIIDNIVLSCGCETFPCTNVLPEAFIAACVTLEYTREYRVLEISSCGLVYGFVGARLIYLYVCVNDQ